MLEEWDFDNPGSIPVWDNNIRADLQFMQFNIDQACREQTVTRKTNYGSNYSREAHPGKPDGFQGMLCPLWKFPIAKCRLIDPIISRENALPPAEVPWQRTDKQTNITLEDQSPLCTQE